MKKGYVWAAMAAAGVGCAGSSRPPETATRGEATGAEERALREDGSEVTGLLGTIRPDQVDATMQARVAQLERCVVSRMQQIEFLGGEIQLSFRIREDGTVAWVYPSRSSFGDLQAEQCILEVARRARFPRPRGGEAEFRWGFAIDPPEDVRAPVAWDAARVRDVLAQRASDLGARCGARGVEVTAYVTPGGQVLTAGASAPSPDALAGVPCVVDAVRGLVMPDPGSYAAKVSFVVE